MRNCMLIVSWAKVQMVNISSDQFCKTSLRCFSPVYETCFSQSLSVLFSSSTIPIRCPVNIKLWWSLHVQCTCMSCWASKIHVYSACIFSPVYETCCSQLLFVLFSSEKTCGNPPYPSTGNGNYNLSVQGSTRIATYYCDANYALKIVSRHRTYIEWSYSRSCDQRGYWSGTTPTCGKSNELMSVYLHMIEHRLQEC